jgi:hypothetical protein
MAFPAFGGRIEPLKETIEDPRIGRNWAKAKTGQGPAEPAKTGHFGLASQALSDMIGFLDGEKLRIVKEVRHELDQPITWQDGQHRHEFSPQLQNARRHRHAGDDEPDAIELWPPKQKFRVQQR